MIFHAFLHFLTHEIYQINKLRAAKMAKKAVLEPLDALKLILREIWVIEKLLNFHTVLWFGKLAKKDQNFENELKAELELNVNFGLSNQPKSKFQQFWWAKIFEIFLFFFHFPTSKGNCGAPMKWCKSLYYDSGKTLP